MIFTTPQFVLFFAAFFATYALAGERARKVVLLVGSYTFYAAWDPRFCALLAGSTVLDFVVGRSLRTARSPRRRKQLLALSIVGNLGALGVFKYYDFFAQSAAAVLDAAGWSVEPTLLRAVLPVGISFYTFQTLSYTVDVYRTRQEPTDSLLDFANYVAFFPQLVAGPIERASRLLPQLAATKRTLNASGFGLIALGAFKKVVIADNLALVVDAAYADPVTASAPALWLGTYAFAVQIYCDFSGYSDIAIGLGRLMGIELMQNFNAPYAATGPREFWRRWHISLSTWLRDYLYIPLGGGRGSPNRVRRNLLITMLLGGLWHGAAWNFVLWGAFHGALLVVARLGPVGALAARVPATVRRVVFFHLVCLGWALFRAESLAECGAIWAALLDPTGWDLGAWWDALKPPTARYLGLVSGLIAAVVVGQMLLRRDSKALVAALWRTPWVVRLYVLVALIAACVVFAPEAPPPFIYFQF